MNKVQVFCRLRPCPAPTAAGDADGAEEARLHANVSDQSISVAADGSNSGQPETKSTESVHFQFDGVFDHAVDQEFVFTRTVKPLVEDTLKGYNTTVMAYGQTGSGKTFTIQGAGAGENRGIIPRAVAMILQFVADRRAEAADDACLEDIHAEASISLVEVYQERLQDLLQSAPQTVHEKRSQPGLRIREGHDGSVWLEGVREVELVSQEGFDSTLAAALKRRSVGSHNMNERSSRSHLVCILTLRQEDRRRGTTVTGKLHLVDLAGSEMVRRTGAEGVRLQEAKFINKSLSALGNVIHALTRRHHKGSSQARTEGAGDGSTKDDGKHHVPYRDSKLTRLLQDSLGGNAKTSLILTASPALRDMRESVSTLRFGSRARRLRNKPRINAKLSEKELRRQLLDSEKLVQSLNARIEELENQLADAKAASSAGTRASLSEEADEPVADASKRARRGHSAGEELKGRENGEAESEDGSHNEYDDNVGAAGDVDGDHDADEDDDEDHTSVFADESDDALNVDGQVTLAYDVQEDGGTQESIRCQVCNMTEAEGKRAEKAGVATLGALFTCDGNCCSYYHVTCAGLEAPPTGEWLCVRCAADFEDDGRDAELALDAAEEQDPNAQVSALSASKLRARYEAMRKERNRILAQWKQERAIAAALEIQRNNAQREQQKEVIRLRDNLETERAASQMAQDRYDSLLHDFQTKFVEFQEDQAHKAEQESVRLGREKDTLLSNIRKYLAAAVHQSRRRATSVEDPRAGGALRVFDDETHDLGLGVREVDLQEQIGWAFASLRTSDSEPAEESMTADSSSSPSEIPSPCDDSGASGEERQNAEAAPRPESGSGGSNLGMRALQRVVTRQRGEITRLQRELEQVQLRYEGMNVSGTNQPQSAGPASLYPGAQPSSPLKPRTLCSSPISQQHQSASGAAGREPHDLVRALATAGDQSETSLSASGGARPTELFMGTFRNRLLELVSSINATTDSFQALRVGVDHDEGGERGEDSGERVDLEGDTSAMPAPPADAPNDVADSDRSGRRRFAGNAAEQPSPPPKAPQHVQERTHQDDECLATVLAAVDVSNRRKKRNVGSQSVDSPAGAAIAADLDQQESSHPRISLSKTMHASPSPRSSLRRGKRGQRRLAHEAKTNPQQQHPDPQNNDADVKFPRLV